MSITALYAEVSVVCMLSLILISHKIGKSMFLQSQRQLLQLVIYFNIAYIITDFLWFLATTKSIIVSQNDIWIIYAAYYLLLGLISFTWFAFSENMQNSFSIHQPLWRWAVSIPELLLIILMFFPINNNQIFYLDAAGQYHTGSLYIVQIIVCYGYVIVTALKALFKSFSVFSYQSRIQLQSLVRCSIPILVFGLLQIFFPTYPLIIIGNTIAIIYIFISLQAQLISVDPLTHLNNRNQLMQYLSSRMSKTKENENLYMLMLDIDKFKHINDTYGHLEGDRALQLVSGCLKEIGNQHRCFIARYGGDEFIILCDLTNDTITIEDFCQCLTQQFKSIKTDFPLTVSIGWQKYNPAISTQQEFIAMADRQLYLAKTSHKQA